MIFFWVNKYFKAPRWKQFSHCREAQARHQAVHMTVCICECTILSRRGGVQRVYKPLYFLHTHTEHISRLHYNETALEILDLGLVF